MATWSGRRLALAERVKPCFKRRLVVGHLLNAVQSAPVRVTRWARAVGVIMSVQQYERLREAAWERLSATMDTLGDKALANDLTRARFEAHLADEC